jgi:PAS domain S-box-containing protein
VTDLCTNVQDANRCIRDLVALSALPAVWVGGDPHQIAEGVADALLSALGASVVYVGLKDASSDRFAIEAARVAEDSSSISHAQEIGQSFAPWLNFDPSLQPILIPNPVGLDTLRMMVKPIGCDPVYGVVAAASDRLGFPSKLDRVLLGVGANQAAIALQNNQLLTALSRSEQELIDFVENAVTCLHWVGPDGTILWANKAELDLLGYRRDEYIGHQIAEFYADPEVIDDILRRLARNETLNRYEARRKCKDGSIKHVIIDSNVLRKDGKFIHSRCFTRDITDSKRAERRLHAQYALTRTIAEAATVEQATPKILQTICRTMGWEVGALWRVGGRELHCVEVWHEPSLKIPEFETHTRTRTFLPGIGLPGRVWASCQPAWIPDVTQDANFPRAPLAAKEGLHGAFAFPILLKDEFLGVAEFFSPEIRMPDEDLLQMLAAIGIEIGRFIDRRRAEEALRDAEREYRAIFDLAGVGAAQTDPSGLFLRVNRKYCEITGYSAKELLGLRFSEIIHADDRTSELAQFSRLVKGEIAEYSAEKRYIRKDGSVIWVHVTRTLIRKPNGEPLHTVAVIQDIDERKRAETELKYLNETLEQRVAERTAEVDRHSLQLRALAGQLAGAEHRQSRRIAQMLHDELQQLLVTAKLRLAVLRARAPSHLLDGLKELEDVIVQSLQSTRTLTVELSPPALRQPGFSPVLQWLARRAKEKHGLEVEVRANGVEPELADELKVPLFESIRELLFNVTKHAQVNKAQVALDSSKPGWLRIAVEDAGVGFSPLALTPEQSGGFGLFSIRERLKFLGGRLEIASQPDKGTQIALVAPIASVPLPQIAMVPPTVAALSHASAALRPVRGAARIRVILADDHKLVRQGLRSIVESQADMQVVGEAADGREAVNLASQLQPDVIVMDVSMPELDGIEATRLITQENIDIHVVGLSMYDREDVVARMDAAGAINCVSKDAAAEILCDAIREAVTRNTRAA